MQRIDLMSKEEIIKLLNRRNRGFEACRNCPAEAFCSESCTQALCDYLFEETEVVMRASIYKDSEEACKEFFGDGSREYSKADISQFAKFLMEKIPKPLDR